jgi:outer membrane protein OmpA-like peptidoglycan-associated protein
MLKKISLFAVVLGLAACGGSDNADKTPTPTVDYVEGVDVSKSPNADNFLTRLAMNYRSYAVFMARTAGDVQNGEKFAQKSVSAFSGELPMPEDPSTWNLANPQLFSAANGALIEQLQKGAPVAYPELSAETQAKYDCWVSATATGLIATAAECQKKFDQNLNALADKMEGLTAADIEKMAADADVARKARLADASKTPVEKAVADDAKKAEINAFINGWKDNDKPVDVVVDGKTADGKPMKSITTRSGYSTISSIKESKEDGRVLVVNNINIPENLIRPIPVTQPVVFNQNIYHYGDQISESNEDVAVEPVPVAVPEPKTPDFVSRDEFINMMLALREELATINSQLEKGVGGAGAADEEMEVELKIQQIPLSPAQSIMEEVFEVKFDFNKSDITPEYKEIIKKLATATNENKNMKVSVIGYTDTVGTDSYNYALGGKRAEAVKKLLIKYGIPADQIVAVSSGKKDLKVKTGDGVKNADNRRVRVVKEVKGEEVGAMPAANTSNIVVSVEGGNAEVVSATAE